MGKRREFMHACMVDRLLYLSFFSLQRSRTLPASVFPNAFNPNLFKVRVNRLLLNKLTLSSTFTSSLKIPQIKKYCTEGKFPRYCLDCLVSLVVLSATATLEVLASIGQAKFYWIFL